MPDVDALLSGPAVRKLLFMADEARIGGQVLPHWSAAMASSPELVGAELLQAVPTMLEVVPAGVNKWAGLRVLLDHLGLEAEQMMAIGDGGNDAGGWGGGGGGGGQSRRWLLVADAGAWGGGGLWLADGCIEELGF